MIADALVAQNVFFYLIAVVMVIARIQKTTSTATLVARITSS